MLYPKFFIIVLEKKKNQASVSKENVKNIQVVSDLSMSGQAVFMVSMFAVEQNNIAGILQIYKTWYKCYELSSTHVKCWFYGMVADILKIHRRISVISKELYQIVNQTYKYQMGYEHLNMDIYKNALCKKKNSLICCISCLSFFFHNSINCTKYRTQIIYFSRSNLN